MSRVIERTSRAIETTSRAREMTSRARETTSRGCRADEGRGKAEGVSGRLETTGRSYSLATTGQLIYYREWGERSQVESQREGSTLSTGH